MGVFDEDEFLQSKQWPPGSEPPSSPESPWEMVIFMIVCFAIVAIIWYFTHGG